MNSSFVLALLIGVITLCHPIFREDANRHASEVTTGSLVRGSNQDSPPQTEKLIFADFEQSQEGRPVSNRGGLIQLTSYQESPARQSRFKGAAEGSPPAPELVRLQKDGPNKSAAFDFELQAPNEYAGVTLEVHGRPDQNGQMVADDLSEYKFLSLQIYATGVPALRLEFVSQGQGIKIPSGYPQTIFKIQPGFNTYRIPLKSITQPTWASVKVSSKELLRKLTSVNLIAYCDKCTPLKGTVVVDNIAFEK